MDELEQMRWWQERYTPFIHDFLATELTEAERRAMPDAATALHEQLGHAFATWMSTEAVTDREAWDRLDPARHLRDGSLVTMLPIGVDILDFVPLFVRFVEHLARRGVIGEAAAARLAVEYPEAAREIVRAEAELDVSIVPGNEGSHCIVPLPTASPECRARVKKTSYLVDRFLRSRRAKHLEASIASMAVHVLVAEHVKEHGHRAWAALDVARVAAGFGTTCYVAPPLVPMFVASWRGFIDWLVDRGRLHEADAERLHEAVTEAGRALRECPMPWAS